MDIANKTGGIVVGTGDLSEAALGWCTFNGDHMSMYHVNSGVPKTLVRYSSNGAPKVRLPTKAGAILRDIADTPITPELLPLAADESLQRRPRTPSGRMSCMTFSCSTSCVTAAARKKSAGWPRRPLRASRQNHRQVARAILQTLRPKPVQALQRARRPQSRLRGALAAW
jgi:hypothetical protein